MSGEREEEVTAEEAERDEPGCWAWRWRRSFSSAWRLGAATWGMAAAERWETRTEADEMGRTSVDGKCGMFGDAFVSDREPSPKSQTSTLALQLYHNKVTTEPIRYSKAHGSRPCRKCIIYI